MFWLVWLAMPDNLPTAGQIIVVLLDVSPEDIAELLNILSDKFPVKPSLVSATIWIRFRVMLDQHWYSVNNERGWAAVDEYGNNYRADSGGGRAGN